MIGWSACPSLMILNYGKTMQAKELSILSGKNTKKATRIAWPKPRRITLKLLMRYSLRKEKHITHCPEKLIARLYLSCCIVDTRYYNCLSSYLITCLK